MGAAPTEGVYWTVATPDPFVVAVRAGSAPTWNVTVRPATGSPNWPVNEAIRVVAVPKVSGRGPDEAQGALIARPGIGGAYRGLV